MTTRSDSAGISYQRILVPLDGSELAELALPHAEMLARRLGQVLILVEVTSPPQIVVPTPLPMTPPAVVLDTTPVTLRKTEEAGRYLETVARRMSGLSVTPRVVEGRPADAIVAEARASGADLIVMGTHGRGGLGRLLFGSVANGVLAHAPCPVLLVRPQ